MLSTFRKISSLWTLSIFVLGLLQTTCVVADTEAPDSTVAQGDVAHQKLQQSLQESRRQMALLKAENAALRTRLDAVEGSRYLEAMSQLAELQGQQIQELKTLVAYRSRFEETPEETSSSPTSIVSVKEVYPAQQSETWLLSFLGLCLLGAFLVGYYQYKPILRALASREWSVKKGQILTASGPSTVQGTLVRSVGESKVGTERPDRQSMQLTGGTMDASILPFERRRPDDETLKRRIREKVCNYHPPAPEDNSYIVDEKEGERSITKNS